MSATRRFAAPLVLFLSGLTAFHLLTGGPVWSYPDDAGAPKKWEYTTATVDPGSLSIRLGELGNEGWEVFSVERAGSAIEQGADARTHLVTDKYQVTAKRPLQ